MKKKQARQGANGHIGDKPETLPEKKKVAVRTDIPIEHVLPADQKAIYTNHLIVHHENGAYHLMFFQVTPPLAVAIGSQEQKNKALRELKSVEAICVSHLVVSSEVMPQIISALAENLQKQQAKVAGELDLIDVSASKITEDGETE